MKQAFDVEGKERSSTGQEAPEHWRVPEHRPGGTRAPARRHQNNKLLFIIAGGVFVAIAVIVTIIVVAATTTGGGKATQAVEAPEQVLSYSFEIDGKSSTFVRRKEKIFDLRDALHKSPYSQADGFTKSYTSSEDAGRKIAANLGVKGSYYGFSASTSMSASSDESSSFHTCRTDIAIVASKYRATARGLNIRPSKKLFPDILEFIQDTSKPEELVDSLGEFFATQVDLGGLFRKTYIMEMEESETVQNIETELQASYGVAMVGSVEGTAGASYGTRSHNTNARTKTQWDCQGGDTTILLRADKDNFNEVKGRWAQSVKDDNLFPFGFKLKPIWKVISEVDPQKGKEVEEYLHKKWKDASPDKDSQFNAGYVENKEGGTMPWALVGPNQFCDQTTVKDLGHVATVADCKARVESDSQCGIYMYSRGDNCWCTLVGHHCNFAASTSGINVYALQAAESAYSAKQENTDCTNWAYPDTLTQTGSNVNLVLSLPRCKLLCDRHSLCEGITYEPASGRCFPCMSSLGTTSTSSVTGQNFYAKIVAEAALAV